MTNAEFGMILLGVLLVVAAYTSRGRQRNVRRISWTDWLIYASSSLFVLVAIILYSDYESRGGIALNLNSQSTVTVLSAVLSFGFTLKDSVDNRRRLRFWGVYLGLILLHFALLPSVLRSIGSAPFLLFIPIALVELFIIHLVLSALGVIHRNAARQ